MQYTICNEIENALFFTLDTVRSCGIGYNGTELYWIKDYHGEPIDADKIDEQRNIWRKMFQEGNQPEQCKHCHLLLTKDWEQNKKFNLLVIAHRTKCSCNCIYCHFRWKKRLWNTREAYNIMPVLNDLEEKNLLADDLHISVSGGECTEYPDNEFEDIANFVLKKKCKMSVYSSGINFSPTLAKCLNAGLCDLVISVDSGTRYVYEKIKRVRHFGDVWKNIKKYAEAATPDGIYGRMTVKYVIVYGMNSSQKAFHNFIKQCRKAKVKHIRIAVEYNWWNRHKDSEIPPRIISLVKYIQNFNDEFSIEPTEFGTTLFEIANKQS
ncbi:MAG: radical SAM protein [Candidatus Gastranaerophilaceae bacterium]